MTDKEYGNLKPGDIVIEIRTGKERKFIRECIVILDPMELQLKGFDNLYNGVRQCEKYAVIEDTNEIGQKIGQIPLYNFINDFKIKKPMENEIKIKVPEGKKAVQKVDENDNLVIKFENAEPIRSKSWEEFCKKHSNIVDEWYISDDSYIFESSFGPHKRDGVRDANFLETKEDAEGILALIQLTRLHDEWVGDWKPNWGDCYIHCIIIQCNSIVVDRFRYEQHTLSFPSYEMAEEFLNCFKPLLEKAKRFI